MEKVILVLFINGKLKISSKNLLCELANNVQYLEVGKKTLVKFIVKGLRGDPKNVNFEVNPNGIFELTTSKWKEIKAKTLMGENWRLQTYITAKKEGEANIQVIVDGKKLNTIKLTTKVQADKDVFDSEDIKKYINENKQSLNYGIECFIAVDNQFAKVVNDNSLRLSSYLGKTDYDRINSYKRKQYIKETKRFWAGDTWVRDKNFKPISFKKEKETVFSDYIKNGITSYGGYHIYYLVILNGYHVLSIIVKGTPCDLEYKILDQLKDRNWAKINEIDKNLLEMTQNNYDYACKSSHRYDIDSTIQLWKLKRK